MHALPSHVDPQRNGPQTSQTCQSVAPGGFHGEQLSASQLRAASLRCVYDETDASQQANT
jgi:hypothetical protein